MKGLASKNWQSVRGRVVESYVDEARRPNGNYSYTAQVSYEYRTPEGRTVRSQRITCGPQGPTAKVLADRRVSRYPVGSEVDVFIDPDIPDSAVIETGIGGSSFFVLGLGLAFTAIGIFLLGRAV